MAAMEEMDIDIETVSNVCLVDVSGVLAPVQSTLA